MTNSSPKPRKQYNKRYKKMTRISLSISEHLLELLDEAAEQDFTTRSDIIRAAVLWYLRPQGRDLAQSDPAEILKVLKHRDTRAKIRKLIQDTPDIDVYDS